MSFDVLHNNMIESCNSEEFIPGPNSETIVSILLSIQQYLKASEDEVISGFENNYYLNISSEIFKINTLLTNKIMLEHAQI